MRAIFITALVMLIPAFAFGQINNITPHITPIRTAQDAVLAEVQESEIYPNSKIKYSTLKIHGEYMSGVFLKSLDGHTQKVRHENPDFELFPGQHILKLRYAASSREWYLETSSHGEIVDAAERRRRARMVELRSHRSLEPELCYQKIKQAYDAEEILGLEFELNDAETCEKYIENYNQAFRVRPKRPHRADAIP